jgi:glycosyltransferase involved in cell wall biosynthesis
MSGYLPSCSVIVPTYNRSVPVVRAVDSVLRNAHACELEVIVVDDASTDDTLSLLAANFDHDQRVRWLISRFNRGPSSARNRGLADAAGEFVLFLDSDDVLMRDALACALQAFRSVPTMQFLSLEGEAVSIDQQTHIHRIVRGMNPGWRTAAFTACALERLSIESPRGVVARGLLLEFGDLFPAVVFGDLFWLSGLIVRRKAALGAGPFSERYRNLEDWDFTARLCRAGIGGYLDYLGFRRETGRADQLSRAGSRPRYAVMHERIIASLETSGRGSSANLRHLLRRARAAADYGLARQLLERGHGKTARRFLSRALLAAYKPLRTLAWLGGGTRLAALARQLSH